MDKNWSSELGITVGYTSFKAKADTLLYKVPANGKHPAYQGRAVLSPFDILIVTLSYGYELNLTKKSLLSLSMGVGYYYGKRDWSLEDNSGYSNSSEELIGRGALVPRLGYAYRFNKFAITPYASYSLMIDLGGGNVGEVYSPMEQSLLHYWTAGLALEYIF